MQKVQYHKDTCQAVKDTLEWAERTHTRIRIFKGGPETGSEWLSESGVVGYVGRTGGDNPRPIMLHNTRSRGGQIIADNCIFAIKTRDEWMWRSPWFKIPDLTLVHLEEYGYPPYKVWHQPKDGRKHIAARFERRAKAQRWLDFMTGARFTP